MFKDLTARQQQVYRRVLDAISLKRRNPALSLSYAAYESGTTLRTMRRYAAPALAQRGRILDVKRSDRLPRHMRILGDRGELTVWVKGSRASSSIGRYNNAVRRLLMTGDDSLLKSFDGIHITDADGNTYEFVTDVRTINRLARAGAVSFPDIYAMESRG